MPDTPTTHPPERAIQFAPKMQAQKKKALLAVAWITQRDGGYEDRNVTALITRKLAAEGYKLPQDRVHDAMIWLDESGYALRSVLGRRHILFMILDDIVVPKPGFVRAHEARQAGRASSNGTGRPRRPPAPQRAPRPPWLPALADGLADWWREDPTEADAWAVEVAAGLGFEL